MVGMCCFFHVAFSSQRNCLRSAAPFPARVAGGLRATGVLGRCRGQALPAGMGDSRAPDLGIGSAFAQLNSPKSQPLHPCSGLSPSGPTGADVGPDRKHLQALSIQHHYTSLCQLLPGTAHLALFLLLGFNFCPANPANHRYFHGNLPEIHSNASTGVTKPPSPLCLVFQAQLLPISSYR